MKTRLLLFVLAGISIFGAKNTAAQVVGDNVFLKGKYVEIGVAPNGGYGSTLEAPAGYHPYLGGTSFDFWDPGAGTDAVYSNLIGFVADYGRDGWTVGSPPFFGDFYLPGSPQEGWGISVGGVEGDAYIPNYQTFGTPTTGYSGAGAAVFSGTNTAYLNYGGVSKGLWQGMYGNLQVRQTTTLDTNKLYFTVNVILVNTGTTPLTDIYYVRTVDPDDEETRTSDFDTRNVITYQLPNAGNKVLVSASGTSTSFATNAYLGLGTKDCRAKCMYFDFGLAPSYDFAAMFAETVPYHYTLGSTSVADVGIALEYNIGTLPPGDSTTLTYCYILNAAYIDSALDATSPEFLVNNDPFLSGDTINLCDYSHDSALVSIGSSGFYSWHWSPSILIEDTTGHANVIDVNAVIGTITYTITGVNVSGGCDTVHYLLTFTRDTFNFNLLNPDTTICLGSWVQANVDGPPHLSYAWTPTTGVSNPAIINPIITPTATTTYIVTASSASGCPSVSRFFTITVNDPVITSVSTSNPTVCGYYDGTITLHGLLPGYIDTVFYTKNGVVQPPLPATVSSGNIVINGLGAGAYTNIYVKVGPCNTNAVTATLVNPPKPTVTVDSALVLTCVGVPVQLHAYTSVSPAGTPISYIWSPPLGLSGTTIANPIVTPIAAGDVFYSVIISPDTVTACWDTARVHVHSIADFTLNNHDTVICLGNIVQGSVTGSSEISYLWTPSATVVPATSTNPVITPTAAGTTVYTVTGSYAHCPDYVHTFSIEVDTPATPIVIRDTICLGMTDSFNFTVPGGDYYHYQWSVLPTTGVTISNDTLPNPILTTSAINIYTLTVTIRPTAATCSITDYVYLDVLPSSITISPTDTMVCKGAVVQAIGTGDPNFSYQWLPTTGIATSDVLNALISPDTTADYVVTASFHRCPDMHAYLHLDVQPNPTVYIGGNRFICPGDTIHINSTVTPNWYPSYIYAWTPASNLDNTNTPTVVFAGTTSSMVYLTVSTPAGCTSNDSAFVTVNAAPGTTIVPNMSFCPHEGAQLVPVTSTPSTFQWMPPFYLSDSTGAAPWIYPITTQTYTIVATTAMGCKDTTTFTATVLPAATMFLPDSVVIYTGESYNIEPTTNCVSFTWFPPAGLNSTIVSNPVATPAISTKYFVTATTEDGCTITDSIAIIVEDGAIMAMPNAFTPGTGVNGLFKINLLGQAQLNYFRVFNRWGNLVFETKNINDGWDGAYKGQAQPFGVFVYEVQAVTESGKIITKRGNITLLR